MATMFDILNDVSPSPMPNVRHYKRTPNIIARQKSFQGEQNDSFLLLVMLVIEVYPEVRELNYTSSGFVMMIRAVVLKAPKESTQLEGPLCLLYGMCRKEHISPKMRFIDDDRFIGCTW